jgi:glycosyltransferase involved in cell wall biosynthesis
MNCEEFHPGPPERGTPIVMLAARVLHAAEIAEFVEVARMMRTHSASPRFVLVGSASDGQPAGASTERLRTWGEEGVIEWWGERKRMAEVLRRASLFVLPASRAEGIPKVLLEAVASGQPIVAVDAPRYREVIQPGVNGYLVSPHDVLAMCHAIELLLRDASLRTRFSDASRRLALAEFSEEIVVRQTLSVYRTLLATRWPHAVSTVQPSRGVSPAPMEMHVPVC